MITIDISIRSLAVVIRRRVNGYCAHAILEPRKRQGGEQRPTQRWVILYPQAARLLVARLVPRHVGHEPMQYLVGCVLPPDTPLVVVAHDYVRIEAIVIKVELGGKEHPAFGV